MQLYALNKTGESVLARAAENKKEYSCLECGRSVRVRKGRLRQPHFYHVNHEVKCSQKSKSLCHLALQEHLLQQLPKGEVELEKRFPEIGRIADVAWIKQYIVFEIQCSPINDDEIIARNNDYRSIGYETVWILHDKRYNKWRHTLAEKTLSERPHYYTNFKGNGRGIVYDQFEVIHRGLRKVRFSPLPVNLAMPFESKLEGNPITLQAAKKRLAWKWRFQGDLLSCCIEDPDAPFLSKAVAQEMKFCSKVSLPVQMVKFLKFIKQKYMDWLMERLQRTVVDQSL